jgi:hypothetical protein
LAAIRQPAAAPPAQTQAAAPAVSTEPAPMPAPAGDEAEHAPTSAVPAQPGPRDTASDDARALRIGGWVAAGAGAAVVLGAWITYGHLSSLQSDYVSALATDSPRRFEAYRRVEAYDSVPLAASAVGAGVLTASLPLWLPEHAGVPWWAWASGGAGVVVGVVGTKLSVDAGHCLVDDFGRCIAPALATRLGPSLILQALPFIAVPIVYGVRALLGSEGRETHDVALVVRRQRVEVTWTAQL